MPYPHEQAYTETEYINVRVYVQMYTCAHMYGEGMFVKCKLSLCSFSVCVLFFTLLSLALTVFASFGKRGSWRLHMHSQLAKLSLEE